MGLYLRGKGSIWWIRYTYKGKYCRVSTQTSNRKLAEMIQSKVVTQIVEGTWFERLPGEKKTLGQLLDRYIEEHSVYNKAPKSIRSERSMKKDILKFFGEVRLKDLTSRRIVEYRSDCMKRGLKPASIRYRLAFMRHAFNIAIREWEWVKDNPASRVTIKVDNARDRWLTLNEEKRLIESCVAYRVCKGNDKVPTYWLQEIVFFALNTGMRQDEILSLLWTNVDLFRKTATVVKSKNGQKRTIPLNQGLFSLLKEKAKVRGTQDGYVFANSAGNKLESKNLRRAFYLALARAKIEDFRFHDLRHTFATRLVQEGVDLYKVSKLLGHKDITMTQRYSHHYPESLRDGVDVLDKFSTNLAQSAPKMKKGLRLVP